MIILLASNSSEKLQKADIAFPCSNLSLRQYLCCMSARGLYLRNQDTSLQQFTVSRPRRPVSMTDICLKQLKPHVPFGHVPWGWLQIPNPACKYDLQIPQVLINSSPHPGLWVKTWVISENKFPPRHRCFRPGRSTGLVPWFGTKMPGSWRPPVGHEANETSRKLIAFCYY